MALLAVNGHIAHFMEMHEKLMDAGVDELRNAKGTIEEKNEFFLDFAQYMHGKFVTQYVQERIYMLHHYDMKSMILPTHCQLPAPKGASL